MGFSTPKRKISDTEHKLSLLCCLDALGCATQEQLWPFVAQLELMEYIPFCMFLDELKNSRAIAPALHTPEGLLYLTQEGQEQLRLFADRVPYTDRQRIREAAPAYAAHLIERRTVRTVYEGSGQACCAMYDGDIPTMLLRTSSCEEALITRAVNGFGQYAACLFLSLYSLPFDRCLPPKALSEAEALAQVEVGKPQLCAFGGRAHAGVVCVEKDGARYVVLLLLPDAASAWGWALMAAAQGEALAQEIRLCIGA